MIKRAEMGLGTLIIFIAVLLAVAIAAGLIIQSSGTLQEGALTTGSEAKSQIATNIKISEVFATDGTDGNLTDFVVTTKLSPGSEAIKFTDVMFTIGSYDTSTTLEFRGTNGTTIKGATGYQSLYTEDIGKIGVYVDPVVLDVAQVPRPLHVDLDEDGINDTVVTCRFSLNCPNYVKNAGMDGKYLFFNLSTAGEIYVPMLNPDGTCCTSTLTPGNNYYGDHLNIHKDGVLYGTVLLQGVTTGSTEVAAANIRVYGTKVKIDDIDDDGIQDYLSLNTSHLLFMMGNNVNASIDLGASLWSDGVGLSASGNIVNENGIILGTVNLSGTSSTRWIIDENVTLTINPQNSGTGYFTVEYLKEAKDHILGNIQRGDVVRIYFETAKPIGEDEEILIRLIPRVGAPSNINIITPDVIVENKIYLFP